ncbi:MAG: polysaccharide ABC transporter ATP-binding protein [Pyrinomonadaceae bacterium]
MTPVIKAEHLSKRYQIGAEQRHNSLRDALMSALRAPLQRIRPKSPATIWALKDVSFEIQPGEVVGIIGRNGAGKSTLLKILSRVTKPTSGRVRLQGRVGSLLEVGTGFHGELTGRENIFLNGAILGMTHNEIKRKFDDIVAFAETEQFLDTPVKHYSSGMTVRLAFAVAAHLEPEILIIDEVLAVGDLSFQKKCLGKMNEVSKAGRTVLFVSHDISAVNSLCERAILLHGGEVVKEGPVSGVTGVYVDAANRFYSPITWIDVPHGDSDEVELHRATVKQLGVETSIVDCRRDFQIQIEYTNKKLLKHSRMFIVVRNAKGEVLFTSTDYDLLTDGVLNRSVGQFLSSVDVPGGLLKAGSYYVTVSADIGNERIVFAEDDAVRFDVFESGDDVLAERHRRVGSIAPLLNWQMAAVTSNPSADAFE